MPTRKSNQGGEVHSGGDNPMAVSDDSISLTSRPGSNAATRTRTNSFRRFKKVADAMLAFEVV